MHPMKEFILEKWASSGLTCQQIKNIIKSGEMAEIMMVNNKIMEKVATNEGLVQKIIDVGYKYIPLLSFTLPLSAGSIYYLMTHPNEAKYKLRTDRIKQFDVETEKQKMKNKPYLITSDVAVPGKVIDGVV